MSLTSSYSIHGALQLSLGPVVVHHVASTTSDTTDLTDMTTSHTFGRAHFDGCGCQYHREKFVTRKEYDEIKDSLSRLENILTTTSPNGQGGPSGSATEEVAAAVNIVKKQAGFLSKVISDAPTLAAPTPPHRNRDGNTSYSNVATGGSISAGVSSSSMSHNRNHLGSNGDSSFAYQPFSLNVPSQSGGGLSDAGDDDYYGSGPRNTISSHSHSTSTDFSRPASSTYPNPNHLQQQQPSGHFQSSIPTSSFPAPSYHSRIPEINLGGLVVEDQSQSTGKSYRGHAEDLYKTSPADPAASLSTLANVANASMASTTHRTSSGHLQPAHHKNHSSSLTSPSLTLAPIAGQEMTTVGRPMSLSISTNASNAERAHMFPLSIAPPRLPIEGETNREAQLRQLLHSCLPRREICDRLVQYYVRF